MSHEVADIPYYYKYKVFSWMGFVGYTLLQLGLYLDFLPILVCTGATIYLHETHRMEEITTTIKTIN